MKIGIDIDGVLNSQYNFCIDYGTKFCNEIGKYKLENVNVLDINDMFLWDESTGHQFWYKYKKELVISLPAKVFSSEVINKLRKENNVIYIITSRCKENDWTSDELKNGVEEITKEWLKKNNINYDYIFFNVKDKGKICKENNIDIMIEDYPENIDKLIGNTEIIIFDYPYNRDEKYKNITRCYSWYDIYNKIKSIKRGTKNG